MLSLPQHWKAFDFEGLAIKAIESAYTPHHIAFAHAAWKFSKLLKSIVLEVFNFDVEKVTTDLISITILLLEEVEILFDITLRGIQHVHESPWMYAYTNCLWESLHDVLDRFVWQDLF